MTVFDVLIIANFCFTLLSVWVAIEIRSHLLKKCAALHWSMNFLVAAASLRLAHSLIQLAAERTSDPNIVAIAKLTSHIIMPLAVSMVVVLAMVCGWVALWRSGHRVGGEAESR